MNKIVKWSGCLVVVAALSGCIVNVDDRNEDDENSWSKTKKLEENNKQYLSQLKIGIKAETVRAALGHPEFTEAFQRSGSSFEVLFFRTHRKHGDGQTTKDECTPLVFNQGVLVGWGEKAYNNL